MGTPFLNVYQEYPLTTTITLEKHKMTLKWIIIMKERATTQDKMIVPIMVITTMMTKLIITKTMTIKIKLIKTLII